MLDCAGFGGGANGSLTCVGGFVSSACDVVTSASRAISKVHGIIDWDDSIPGIDCFDWVGEFFLESVDFLSAACSMAMRTTSDSDGEVRVDSEYRQSIQTAMRCEDDADD